MRKTLKFPADTAVLAEISEMIAETSQKAGFNEEEISQIQLSVDEACTNTIMHGLKQDSERTFELELQWNSGEIEIVISESGVPFDPTSVEEPDLSASLEERSVGGLGIYFIKQLMDEVEYRLDDRGMKILRMIKRRKS